MKCPHCGFEARDGRSICPRCGRRLSSKPKGGVTAHLYRDRRRRLRLRKRLRWCAAAVAAVLAVVVLLRQAARPVPAPSPTPEATQAATVAPEPQATGASAPTQALSRPTDAPTGPQPTFQLPQNYGDTPVPSSVNSREDLIALYWWMIYSGNDTAALEALSVSESTIAEIADKFSNYFDAYSYVLDPPALKVTFKPGLAALLAIQNGETDALDAAGQTVAERAQAAVAELARPGMTDVEKELAIHDYIASHCEYDDDDDGGHSGDALGFFRDGRCRCAGYVDTFRLLGRLAGLEVEMIGGTTTRDLKGSKGHAWNLVRLDGLWYAVDVTWDDMINSPVLPEHVFFNLPVGCFGAYRIWDAALFPGGAQAVELDDKYYYNRPEYVARSVDAAVESAVRQIDATGTACLLFPEQDLARATALALAEHYGAKGRCVALSQDLDIRLYRFSLKQTAR